MPTNEDSFTCPYCKNMVIPGTADKHANTIERKNLKEKATITVTCVLVRSFEIQLVALER